MKGIQRPNLRHVRRIPPRHIPALFTATVMTFGEMWLYLDERAAILEFGLPNRIASIPSAAAVRMHTNNERTAVLSMRIYALHFLGSFITCDTILTILSACAGAVDSYVV